MPSHYIACDSQPQETTNFLRCYKDQINPARGTEAELFTFDEIQAQFSTAAPLAMDNEDYQIVAEHAALLLIVALGVSLIRKTIGT